MPLQFLRTRSLNKNFNSKHTFLIEGKLWFNVCNALSKIKPVTFDCHNLFFARAMNEKKTRTKNFQFVSTAICYLVFALIKLFILNDLEYEISYDNYSLLTSMLKDLLMHPLSVWNMLI